MTITLAQPRSSWTALTDPQLLAQCEVDTYRASGPGGQKRNKTSSAVRLRHLPTALIVIAEESRSQHENKAKAQKRLRHALFLHQRDTFPEGLPTVEELAERPEMLAAFEQRDRLKLNPKNPNFWEMAGLILDLLVACVGQVSIVAELLNISTANLVDFLLTEPKLWQEANRIRVELGLKSLKS